MYNYNQYIIYINNVTYTFQFYEDILITIFILYSYDIIIMMIYNLTLNIYIIINRYSVYV